MKTIETTSGIYLLPNLFTTASLFAAFYAMVQTFGYHYESAAMAIFIGMIADALDGRIARLTNTQSSFGAQYDSLSDMATFGMAPGLLMYGYSLHHLGKLGWLCAFIYVAAVALRLARFNVQLETADKRYFTGLPCPPAAGVISGFIWMSTQQHWHSPLLLPLLAGLSVVISLLMVCNLKYNSFKEIDFRGKVPFLYLIFMVSVFVAVAAAPAIVLFIGFSIFALSGPIMCVVKRIRYRRLRRKIFLVKS